ncbi:MAG: diguanylate cyclase [Chitinispirillales bacterium]|jgi:diguanylate cyclase (GGDEF)-like protein|nr:diguanylate cyclase [Chitinispirillales bacterium]
MTENRVKQEKRLHFGVLFSSIDSVSQCEIWYGIVAYAKENNINLTAYVGTYQSKDGAFDTHYETCLSAIKSNDSLDGVILFSGFIAEDIGSEIDKFKEYAKNLYKKIPLVSVSFPISEIPSVLVDNEKGIYCAVDHLIKNHSKKKIAFVRGPYGHPEAEARLEGYKKALKDNGIKFNADYVLPGHFSYETGRAAVAELIDKRKLSFDAIAVSDDEMAIGVVEELNSRNILVPTNIAVTGFDDEVVSEMYIPSLSTVRQAFFDIGVKSVKTLYNQIMKVPVKKVEFIPSLFVMRQSCGCLGGSVIASSVDAEETSKHLNTVYSFVLRKFISCFPKEISSHHVHSWATALVEEITRPEFSKERFLHLFNDILIYYRRYSRDFTIWHEVINILFEGVEFHRKKISNVNVIFSALSSASGIIYDILSREEKFKRLEMDEAKLLMRKTTNKLVLTFDMDAMCEELIESMPEFSIYTVLIGLYKNPVLREDVNADRNIDKVVGFDGQSKISLKHNARYPVSFSNYSTISGFEFEKEHRMLFFIPLFFKDEELGVMLISYNSMNPMDIYETLRINISTAVKGAELLERVKVLSITDEMTGLLNRRGFFQFAHSRIVHLLRRPEIVTLVLFIDMDGLKFINDNYGHKEGDIAISVCARLLRDVLREEDIIGRIGGDEFVVFSSVKKDEDCSYLVNRIRKKFEEYNDEKNHQYMISCSVGAVVLDKTTKENFEAALLKADSVLYAEKSEKKKKGIIRL